jgi:haloacetate dehalogenase
MFEGFERVRIETEGASINVVYGGKGPPVLLLHGYPQTYAMWHLVAPRLAESFTVVATDLRGYGDSSKPEGGVDHAGYSKRVMAADQVEVMEALGFGSFAVVGHDRGGRVAYRMALDHPSRIGRLAVLDIVPTLDQWDTLRGTAAVGVFHWYLLAQPAPFPERLIEPQAEYWLRQLCGLWAADPTALDEAMPRYIAAFTPPTIRASCDDYRAGAGIDVELDRADRAADRRITCPVLALWGDATGRRPPLLDTWRRWADDVTGRALPCGHFLPEEAPEATLAELRPFLTAD